MNNMISTGLKKLDQFLGGGIKEGLITDVYGSSGTGKTQLILQISLNVLKNGGQVLFQDTTNGFRPERLVEIMGKQEINSALLEKIKVGLITNTTQQIQYLSKISIKNFSLIIIDNVTDLFSFEYSKKEHALEKHIFFMKYMHDLSNIAINTKIPIIVTNTVGKINDFETENLEKSISMFTHIKIRLSKNNNERICQVISPFENKKFSYIITPSGLQNTSQSI